MRRPISMAHSLIAPIIQVAWTARHFRRHRHRLVFRSQAAGRPAFLVLSDSAYLAKARPGSGKRIRTIQECDH